jgi:hypothetical protein
MRRSLLFVVCLVFCASAVSAGVPNVALFFDKNLQQMVGMCPYAPVGTVLDTVFVVANNFDMWMNAIEYSIEYPPQVVYLGDLSPANTLTIGNSPNGITIAWTIPANAFVGLVVTRVVILWLCDGCGGNLNQLIVVRPHPMSGFLRAVRWPDLVIVDAVGLTSLICATIPAQETTWGGIKALYQ